MEKNLFRYIWLHTKRSQFIIAFLSVVAQLSYFIYLGIPKTIVNKALDKSWIQNHFGGGGNDHARLGEFVLSLPKSWGGDVTVFEGVRVTDPFSYLYLLCFLFLFFAVTNSLLKQRIQTMSGQLGERMLRRMRYDLFDRAVRFPIHHFRKVRSAEIATMIKDEVDPIGGFIGDAFKQPMLLGGSALTALVFIFAQNIWLGIGTILSLAAQLAIIPRLRRKVLQLGRQRQVTARQLAGRIAECVDGISEVRTNGTVNFEKADIVSRLGHIFFIRFELYKRKFFVKNLNNMMAQITPFLFYSIGGYLVLTGRLQLGSIIAAVAAYKDLPSPIKELIDWDQQRQDVQIKYEQVVDQFSVSNMIGPERHSLDPQLELEPADFRARNLVYIDETESKLLDGASLEIGPEHHVAVIGPPGSGKEVLGAVLARLIAPNAGTIELGDKNWLELPEPQVGRYLGYVADETYLFAGSIGENITYGLKVIPVEPARYEGAEAEQAERRREETLNAGNPLLDIADSWLDYRQAGVSKDTELQSIIATLLEEMELADDVYQFGLRGRINAKKAPRLADAFLEARKVLRGELVSGENKGIVEVFDPARYTRNMTVAENLLFGTPSNDVFVTGQLAGHPYVRTILRDSGLEEDLARMGHRIAETMVELFADLPPDHPFFEQFSFINQEDIAAYEQLLARIGKMTDLKRLRPGDIEKLIELSFPYNEPRHRLELLDEKLENKIVAARRLFAKNITPALRASIEFYDPDKYNSAASVQDNILFGRPVYGQAKAVQRIGKLLSRTIAHLHLRTEIIEVGLAYSAGTGGKRLGTQQRQKLALVRALVKRPNLLILNNALAVFDDTTQRRLIMTIRNRMKGRAILYINDNAAAARQFDYVMIMRAGRIVETGQLAALDLPGAYMRELAGEPSELVNA